MEVRRLSCDGGEEWINVQDVTMVMRRRTYMWVFTNRQLYTCSCHCAIARAPRSSRTPRRILEPWIECRTLISERTTLHAKHVQHTQRNTRIDRDSEAKSRCWIANHSEKKASYNQNELRICRSWRTKIIKTHRRKFKGLFEASTLQCWMCGPTNVELFAYRRCRSVIAIPSHSIHMRRV